MKRRSVLGILIGAAAPLPKARVKCDSVEALFREHEKQIAETMREVWISRYRESYFNSIDASNFPTHTGRLLEMRQVMNPPWDADNEEEKERLRDLQDRHEAEQEDDAIQLTEDDK